MLFDTTEDDDLDSDFAPAAGSKLSSLFGQEKMKENAYPTLFYTPPKKPKATEQFMETQQNPASNPPTPGSSFSVVTADIAHSFKLDTGVYCDQRKVGVALLRNAQAHVFQIILYRTTSAGKQDYIAVAKITEGFRFLVQPKFYCSFNDDTNNNWSLVFNCQDSCMQFARQVGAAHFRAILGKAVVTQMIDPGDEGSSKGESTHLTISQQYFDVNSILPYKPMEATIKVSLNPSQAKWSEGLVSASPGSRWAIFIPASTILPWASEVCHSPLVLEVVVEKMLPTSHPQTAERVTEKLTSGPKEGSVESVAESLSNKVSASKASLISRVARMGQATLPLKGAVHFNPSDSETEEESSSATSANSAKPPPNVKPQLKSKFSKSRSPAITTANSESEPTYVAMSAAPAASTIWRPAVMQSADNKFVQYLPGNGQMVPITSASPYQVMTASPVTSPSEPMAMYLSEARMQNTEMRMNMNRIVDKIDSLSTKVDTLSSSGMDRPSIVNASVDAASLLSSVEKIVKDNQALTAEVAGKNEKINELNQRIFSLVDNNAKILDQNRVLLEDKQKASEAGDARIVLAQKQQIEELENEKTAFIKEIAELKNRLEALEDSNSDLSRSMMSELSAKDDELSAKLSELGIKDSELTDLKNALSVKEAELNETIADYNKFRSSAEKGERRVKEVEEKLKRYEADNSELKDLVTSLSVNISELESTLSDMKVAHAEEKTDIENKNKTYEDIIAQMKTKFVAQMRLQSADAGLLRAMDLDATVTDLKVLMNRVYRKISQYFDINSTVSGIVVRQTVALILKSEVTQYTEELLMKKNQSVITNNVSADPGKAASLAVKEPSVNPLVPAVNPVVVLTETPKPEEPVIPIEPRRSSSESQTISNPVSSEKMPSDAEVKTVPKVSGAEETRPRNEFWRSEPPPVPKFDDEEESDDWLNM